MGPSADELDDELPPHGPYVVGIDAPVSPQVAIAAAAARRVLGQQEADAAAGSGSETRPAGPPRLPPPPPGPCGVWPAVSRALPVCVDAVTRSATSSGSQWLCSQESDFSGSAARRRQAAGGYHHAAGRLSAEAPRPPLSQPSAAVAPAAPDWAAAGADAGADGSDWSSSAIPSDPAALQRLLTRLKARFPGLEVPTELAEVAAAALAGPSSAPAPGPAGVPAAAPHGCCAGAGPCASVPVADGRPLPPPPPIPPPPPPRARSASEPAYGYDYGLPRLAPALGIPPPPPPPLPPAAEALPRRWACIESSLDTESRRSSVSPCGRPQDGLGGADGAPLLGALRQQEEVLAAEHRIITELLRAHGAAPTALDLAFPAAAEPAQGAPPAEASAPAAEQRDWSPRRQRAQAQPPVPQAAPPPAAAPETIALHPRHTFYDRLGRQLTDLLLQAGAPLPRFPLRAEQKDAATQARPGSGGESGGEEPAAEDEETLFNRAHAAAEMFLRDYYDHKRALAEAEAKINDGENENLALRSQLDLAVVKMVAAQKELDKYADYFNSVRPEAQGQEGQSDQVRALVKKLQQMGEELRKLHGERSELLRAERRRVEEAVQRALAGRDDELGLLRARLKEKKRVIRDMKLMLHTHLAAADPSDTMPRIAFADIPGLPGQGQRQTAVSPAIALP